MNKQGIFCKIIEDMNAGFYETNTMKIKPSTFFHLMFLLPLTTALAGDLSSTQSAVIAVRFLVELSKKSPVHDEVPVRDYSIRDMDADGQFEVLESISAYERSTGFLNAELAPAFEWIDIYRERNGRFIKATSEFKSFLTTRKIHYEFWLRTLQNPVSLDSDSRNLVEKNQKEFQKILRDYLQQIESMLK